MRQLSRLATAAISIGFITLTSPGFVRAQNDVEKTYKTHCVLCHAPDGSGSAPTGKALKAEDLRSELIQKKTDAELAAAITNGKGKMPAFGKKLKPDQIAQLVAYIRALPKNK
jgi:mono/diheme cytochrome c family protein